jgi:hypothetical protein
VKLTDDVMNHMKTILYAQNLPFKHYYPVYALSFCISFLPFVHITRVTDSQCHTQLNRYFQLHICTFGHVIPLINLAIPAVLARCQFFP